MIYLKPNPFNFGFGLYNSDKLNNWLRLTFTYYTMINLGT